MKMTFRQLLLTVAVLISSAATTMASITLKEPAKNANDYYQISEAAELYWFADKVNGGSTSIKGMLTADIVVNENVLVDGALNGDGSGFEPWTPIGNESNIYQGRFDGDGHTISGLYISTSNDYVGLFGYCNGAAEIKNVGIINSYIEGGSYVGSICGYGYYTSITNSYNAGAIYGDLRVGGICGSEGFINNCYNTGNVTGNQCIGGISGQSGRPNNCFNTGNILGIREIGGICGWGTPSNCYNTGTVKGSDNYVGGICGGGSPTNCYYLTGCAKDGNDVEQNGKGNSSKGQTTADVLSQTAPATTYEFGNGKITFKLNGSTSTSTLAWYQTLGEGGNATPILVDNGSNTVYVSSPCHIHYSNTPDETINHNLVNGICSACDECESIDGVYQLANADQLYWFADFVNNKGNMNANAVLTADIVINENVLKEDGSLNGTPTRQWTPIGIYGNNYKGTFDGQGHTISGLYFNNTSNGVYPNGGAYVGLFGQCYNPAEIKNVGIIDSYIKGSSCVGSICGRAEYLTKITNCYNSGSVTGSSQSVGGVCGYAGTYSRITNCYNTGTVKGGSNLAGSICGYNSGGTITNSYYLAGCAKDGSDTEQNGVGGKTDVEGQTTSATAEEFASGKIAYLLNGKTSDGELAWYQTIGDDGDKQPVLVNNGHNTVYASTPCPQFSNTPGVTVDHEMENGKCKHCGCVIIDGIRYTLSETNNTATVLSNGYSGNIAIPATVSYSDKTYTVTTIDAKAFTDCTNLTSVTLSENVTSIGSGAFNGCISLTKVTINSNTITSRSYSHNSNLKNKFGSQVTEYVFGEGVTTIGDYALYECTELATVTIPESIRTIGNNAFYNCSSLTSVTFPKDIKTIGQYAFYNCSGLSTVTFEGETPPTFEYRVFYATNNCPIYVPSLSAVTAYKNASNMSDYANRIRIIPTFIVLNGVKYQLKDEGTFEVVANDYSGEVVISDSIDLNGVSIAVASISSDAFNDCSGLTSITIPKTVTSIGNGAFEGCDNIETLTYNTNNIGQVFRGNTHLKTVNIGDSVTSIGYYTFYGCTDLTTVNIPKSVKSIGTEAFRGCANLKSVTIPESITSISNFTFYGCASLTSVIIPKSVRSIGWSAFGRCTSLETVTINDGVTQIDNYAFFECSSLTSVTIPESVTSIGKESFQGCTGLKSVTIPASVTSIGTDAFKDCSSIDSLTYNTNVLGQTFRGNTSLKTVVIGNSVTSIGYNAFYGCSGLTSINIPESVTSIGGYAFYGCSSIKSLDIPASVTTIGDNAFKDCNGIETLTYNTNAVGGKFSNIPSLKTVTIGDSVTTIPWGAFQNCTNLTTVVIPNSVTTIGSDVFYGCKNLKSLTLPFVGDKRHAEDDKWQWPLGYIFCDSYNYYEGFNGGRKLFQQFVCDNPPSVNGRDFYIPRTLEDVTVTDCDNIQYGAFYNCANLKSVTISSDVTNVGSRAFYGCSIMEKIVFECETPPDFGANVFYNTNNCPIYVPTEEAVAAYRAKENMGDYYYRIMVNPYCKITVATNNSDYGTVSGGGTYNRTTTPTVTITATAAENCSFVCWAEDGATEATREITLSGAATYTAIFKRTVTISNVVAEDKEYNGTTDVDFSYNVDGLFDGDDVTVTPTAAFADANAGEGKVVSYSFELSGNDADNYVFAEGSQSGTVTANITPVLVSEPEIVLSATEFTYSGEAQTPTVTVKAGETVIAAAEYEVSFSDDVTNVGEKTVTVSNKAGNYTVNGSATYTISPAAETPNKPEAAIETRCINTELVELPENWQWAENKALELGDNTATAEYNGADAGNYLIESVDVTITRIACEHAEGVDILNAVEPTCTAEGYSGDQRCKICGEIIVTGDSIPAAGHKADSVLFENIVSSTCTIAGSYDSVVYCSVCHVEISRDSISVPANGHKADSVAFENVVEATCTVAGSKDSVVYCSVCKAEVSRTKVVIPAHGHTVVVDSAVAATATTDGLTEGSHCSVCGETIVAQEVIPATGEQGGNNQGGNENNGGNENQGGENTEPATAVAESAAQAVNIYVTGNTIVVENATDEIFVYNVMGGLVARGTDTTITVSHTGVYIVKTGNTAKRVMIY